MNESDVQETTSLLRGGILKRRRPPRLEGEAEIDEVYVVAGHKGRPDRIQGRKGRRNHLKGTRGWRTLEKEKTPIFGMIQRDGEVCITMLENVQQKTIMPLIAATVAPGTTIYTGEKGK